MLISSGRKKKIALFAHINSAFDIFSFATIFIPFSTEFVIFIFEFIKSAEF